MRSRLNHTIISLLVIFVVTLGLSQAGDPVCPSGCPASATVPDCCATMANDSVFETQGAADLLPGPADCRHDGICLKGFQAIDVYQTTGLFEYDNALVLFHLDFQVQPHLFYRAMVLVLSDPPLEKSPPIFLRNCSFLI